MDYRSFHHPVSLQPSTHTHTFVRCWSACVVHIKRRRHNGKRANYVPHYVSFNIFLLHLLLQLLYTYRGINNIIIAVYIISYYLRVSATNRCYRFLPVFSVFTKAQHIIIEGRPGQIKFSLMCTRRDLCSSVCLGCCRRESLTRNRSFPARII